MRYPASEKLEIIRLVEQSHLPVRRTLEKLGIQPARFYRWYDRLQTGGLEALEDKASRPTRVWNRIPDAIRERIVQLALDELWSKNSTRPGSHDCADRDKAAQSHPRRAMTSSTSSLTIFLAVLRPFRF